MKVTLIPIVIDALGTFTNDKGSGELGNKRTSGDYPNDSIIKIGSNSELWNMKVKVIPIVIGALGTKPKRLVQGLEDLEIRGQEETIQTTVLSRSARILRRVLET